jgi:hypothetical protein
MRLIFIPGLGEEASIFDKLHPLLPGEKVFLSFWQQLPEHHRAGLDAALFARELIAQYNITANDVVIGHSTGGWVALHIKQQVACPIVQIASWTNRQKLALPPVNRRVLFLLAQSGVVFNSLMLRWSIRRRYRHQPSATVFKTVFTRMMQGNKQNVVNQLRLILNPVNEPVTVEPDVVIHAKADPVVRFPDGAVWEVPGDHFSLYTHPEAVAEPITAFLQNKISS